MSNCIKCGSTKAYWMVRDKENKAEYYCDPCFKKHDLADYKKEMDEYHKKKKEKGEESIYVDGDIVKCKNCHKKVKVKFFESSKRQVAVVDPNEIKSLALRCQNCGFVTCFSCTVGPSNDGIPICPSCNKKGAPYFFMR